MKKLNNIVIMKKNKYLYFLPKNLRTYKQLKIVPKIKGITKTPTIPKSK